MTGLSEQELDRWGETIASLEQRYRNLHARGKAHLVEIEAGAFFDHKGIAIPPKGTDAYARLFRECHKQWIRAAGVIRQRNRGEIIDTPEVPLPAQQEKARPKPGAGGAPTITELWAIWLRERQPSPKLEIEWKAAVRRFTDLKGDVPVTEVTRDDAWDFRDYLAELPGRRRAKMAPGTVRKQLTAMSTLFQVAVERRITDRNPFERIKVQGEGAADERECFTLADLRTIFSNPMPGNRDSDRWLPLLALYTGARPEELAQLKIADVRADDGGFRYFDITNEPGNNLKEGAGNRRKVPVHSAIVACGFLAFCEERSRSAAPEAWLFSDVEKSKRDKLSEAFSKRFGRHLRAIGIADPDKVFYSFRHTFKSQGRACEIDEPILDALQGHAPRHVGGRYGLGKARIPYPLSVLAKEIEKLTFPGLEVDTLPAFQDVPKRRSSGAPFDAVQSAG